MATPGSLVVPVAVLVLLLCGAPWAHGRRSDVRVVTDENWRELLEGEWMIEFYAPWCPACQNLQPEWESFAEWGEDLEVHVAKVDVTEQPGLSGRFIITALPTIYHCKDGEFRRYQGPRTKKDFINFVSDREWKSIEPVSSWFGPGSILMSSMSALFQLSMWIRTCHNYFIEDLGLPVWGSYTVFALATLLSGLLLGLCMIFVADCLCPSKRRRPQPYPSIHSGLPGTSSSLSSLERVKLIGPVLCSVSQFNMVWSKFMLTSNRSYEKKKYMYTYLKIHGAVHLRFVHSIVCNYTLIKVYVD
ncbi:thioredoxin related transmembrane protein 1 [Phyllostomus discolor]|uniref:Thioredoxin-related transmembrane protein 1 n=1 Tax=Phyllostomus discolor TaxID=89673 RepID=A0A834EY11_9CHIR|nr:thioredoxin related transmembrane protein 1 [Phyllostomus discolor]